VVVQKSIPRILQAQNSHHNHFSFVDTAVSPHKHDISGDLQTPLGTRDMAPNKKAKIPSKIAHQQTDNSPRPRAVSTSTEESWTLPLEVQQLVLSTFRHAFTFDQNVDVKATIQEVKGFLYNRDFASAFGKQDYLDAYALRWSASRALGYAAIFTELQAKHDCLERAHVVADPSDPSASKVVCIGGGAGSEVVALASVVRFLSLSSINVVAIDIADWSQSLEKLESSMMTPPPLSAYASEAAKAANKSLIEPGQLSIKCMQRDILVCAEGELHTILVGASLCTIMFTLNELFTSSISLTTAFLLALTDAIEPGSWLVVVDSPGSYSEVKIGQDANPKQYPMKWLLDHALLKVAGEKKWEKAVTNDSKWFRMDAKLKYPIELENMRYQIHLYQRQSESR